MKNFILSAMLIAAISAVMASCEKENTSIMDDGRVRFTSGITATPTRVAIDPQGEYEEYLRGSWNGFDNIQIEHNGNKQSNYYFFAVMEF